MIWKYPLDVVVLNQTRQSLTCSLYLDMRFSFLFTEVYASNIRDEMADMWSEIVDLNQYLNLENSSWLVGGNLNRILHFSKHSSPSRGHD